MATKRKRRIMEVLYKISTILNFLPIVAAFIMFDKKRSLPTIFFYFTISMTAEASEWMCVYDRRMCDYSSVIRDVFPLFEFVCFSYLLKGIFSEVNQKALRLGTWLIILLWFVLYFNTSSLSWFEPVVNVTLAFFAAYGLFRMTTPEYEGNPMRSQFFWVLSGIFLYAFISFVLLAIDDVMINVASHAWFFVAFASIFLKLSTAYGILFANDDRVTRSA